MTGERRLYRHLGGFQVAYLPHHDDVRVLAQQGAYAVGEVQADVVLHLHLVERRFDHFDRVFHRADIHLRRGELLQRGIQCGGLAGTGRAGHQDDAVGLACPVAPQQRLFAREAEIREILDQHLRIKDPHHQLLAKGSRHRGKTQLDLFTIVAHRLDTSVLRPALLHHVHASQQLDAVGDRAGNRGGQLIDLMQNPVDTEANDADVTARLQMDVAGALLKCIFEQPVHQCDDVLLIGIQILVLAQLDQLLEVLHADGLPCPGLVGELHRIGQTVDFRQVMIDVERTGQHQLDLQIEDTLQLRHPIGNKRFGGGDGHLMFVDLDRHDLEPFGIRLGDDIGNAAEIQLQRVDVEIGHADTRCQPLGEKFDTEQPAWRQQAAPLLLTDRHKRMAMICLAVPGELVRISR